MITDIHKPIHLYALYTFDILDISDESLPD